MTATARAARPRGPRGPYRKSRMVCERILDAGLEVFAQSGYHKGSVRAIATRAGMSEAGLLHHFPSKGALLAALLELRDQRADAFVGSPDTDGVAGLVRLLELARFNASQPGVVELYCVVSAEATAPDHPAHPYFVARYERLRRQIATCLEQVQRDGGLQDGADPAAVAAWVIAAWDGLQVQWLLDRDCLDIAEELAACLDSVLLEPLPRYVNP